MNTKQNKLENEIQNAYEVLVKLEKDFEEQYVGKHNYD